MKMPMKSWHLLLIVFSLWLVHGSCIKNGFVWDDTIFLVGNNTYRYCEVLRMFFALGNGVEYLPVRDLSFALDYSLWGEHAAGFHLTNLIVFALTACFAYLFCCQAIRFLAGPAKVDYRESDTERLALFATLCFVLHPIQSQAVNFITCRNVLLSGWFFFLSLYLYLTWAEEGNRRLRRLNYPASLFCFLLALFSKATVISMPLLLLALIAVGRSRGRKLSYLPTIPFFLLCCGAFFLFKQVALQAKVMRFDLPEFGIHSLWVTGAKAVQIPFFYLGKILYPEGFAAEYDIDFLAGFWHPGVLACLAALGFLVFFAWRWRARQPLLAFGAAWFLITLLPVLNFFPTRPAVADRYAFLPVFGVCYLLAISSGRLLATRFRLPVACALLASLVFLGSSSAAQCAVWLSEKSLWENVVLRSPSLHKGYANLASYYSSTGGLETARRLYRKGEQLDPTKPDLEYAEGALAFNKKDFPTAREFFQEALDINEGHLRALYFAGIACEKLGDQREAAHYFNRMFDSAEPDLKNILQRSSIQLQFFVWPKVRPELDALKRSALADASNLPMLEQVADAYFYVGLYDDALGCYRDLEQKGYRSVSLFNNEGAVLERQLRLSEAVDCYRKTLVLQKENGEALNRLGLIEMNLGDYRAALDSFKRGAGSGNGSYRAAYNLAASYFLLGDKANALSSFRCFDAKFPREAFRSVPYLRRLREI